MRHMVALLQHKCSLIHQREGGGGGVCYVFIFLLAKQIVFYGTTEPSAFSFFLFYWKELHDGIT